MLNIPGLRQRATDLKPVLGSLLAAGITTFILSQRHMGEGLAVVAVIFIPWLLFKIYDYVKEPEQRRLLLQKILIWLLAISLITVIHLVRHHYVRTHAQNIADRIQNFADQHGHYPPDLQSIGTSAAQEKAVLGMFYYGLPDNKDPDAKPDFFYVATYMHIEVDRYDFAAQRWEHVYD